MGAKASTANGDEGSGRERTFSTGSASDVVAGSGFSILRSLHNISSSDTRRARSLSSVLDGHENVALGNSSDVQCEIETLETESNSADDQSLDSPLGANIGLSLGLGRVYTARSLPSHIWSLNGEYSFYVLETIIMNCVFPKPQLAEDMGFPSFIISHINQLVFVYRIRSSF